MAATVDTTLITPLAAYLDLRTRGRAAFLLESVDRGRFGRYSLVGCGDRIVSFEEAEAARRARGRLPRLRPCREARADRAAAGRRPGPAGEPVRGCRCAASLRPSARGPPTCSQGPPELALEQRRIDAVPPALPERTHRLPDRADIRTRGRALPGAHPPGRRVPDRALPARRATNECRRGRAVPGAAPRQPVALSLPARAQRCRARRLVARDAREARGGARIGQSDRGLDEPRRRRRGAPPHLREGPRGAHHARRPRTQRPLARLPAGDRRKWRGSSRRSGSRT